MNNLPSFFFVFLHICKTGFLLYVFYSTLGRLDLAIAVNIVAYDYAGKNNSPFEVVWQGSSGELIGICLKKGNDELTAAIDNALDELFKDGTMRKISLKIFNRDLVSTLRDF